jgi:hypothetical protein
MRRAPGPWRRALDTANVALRARQLERRGALLQRARAAEPDAACPDPAAHAVGRGATSECP